MAKEAFESAGFYASPLQGAEVVGVGLLDALPAAGGCLQLTVYDEHAIQNDSGAPGLRQQQTRLLV